MNLKASYFISLSLAKARLEDFLDLVHQTRRFILLIHLDLVDLWDRMTLV